MSESSAMPSCPMANTCKRMMGQPHFGMPLIVIGLFLILMGVTVLVEPGILIWMVALMLVALGVAVIAMAVFMRRMASRFMAESGTPA